MAFLLEALKVTAYVTQPYRIDNPIPPYFQGAHSLMEGRAAAEQKYSCFAPVGCVQSFPWFQSMWFHTPNATTFMLNSVFKQSQTQKTNKAKSAGLQQISYKNDELIQSDELVRDDAALSKGLN